MKSGSNVSFLSRPHHANRNDDDQNDGHDSANERKELADLGPAKVGLFTPEKCIVAWSVDIVHPELHVVGVQRLLALGIERFLEQI